MGKPSPLRDTAELAARLVYPETELGPRGSVMYDLWDAAAKDVDEPELLWAQDWPAVMRAFRKTDGAVKNLNLYRQSEEEEPLVTEEALSEFFQDDEDWTLSFLGAHDGFAIRVWSYDPWDGNLAFAVASDDEGSIATATNIN